MADAITENKRPYSKKEPKFNQKREQSSGKEYS